MHFREYLHSHFILKSWLIIRYIMKKYKTERKLENKFRNLLTDQ
jgi:hypothetical protein